jgi:hypothetical protein
MSAPERPTLLFIQDETGSMQAYDGDEASAYMDHLEAENAALREVAEAAKRTITVLGVEWQTDHENGGEYCPVCGRTPGQGHGKLPTSERCYMGQLRALLTDLDAPDRKILEDSQD